MTHHYDVCKTFATELRAFAAQGTLFHEWHYVEQPPFFSILNWITKYVPQLKQLLLRDFEPSGCVRGSALYYNQLDEASASITSALEESFGVESLESSFQTVLTVIRSKGRTESAKNLLSELAGTIKVGAKKADILYTDAEVLEILSPVRERLLQQVGASEEDHRRVDAFFRRLHVLCDEHKDVPPKQRPRFDPFSFGDGLT